MKEKGQIKIELFETEEIGIIISFPSCVLYSNQVGGYACLQNSYEGVYAPLHNSSVKIEEKLNKYFTGKKWKGNCSNGIDLEDANFVDSVLQTSYTTNFLKVNREKLKDSCESWIYVNGTSPIEEVPIISGIIEFEAVLTWQNSD